MAASQEPGGGVGGRGRPGTVTLTKSAPAVSLEKPRGDGWLTVNLNWNAPGARRGGGAERQGWLSRLQAALAPAGDIDLDLGCLWEFTDGSKGVVQALGKAFQAKDAAGKTVIHLDGDDRSGAVAGGENLRISMGRIDSVRRILVFALIYEGAPNWQHAQAVVTLDAPGEAPIEVLLDEPDRRARICGVALIENSGQGLTVQREVRYVRGAQRALDRAYGWGMQWTAGRK